MRDYPRLGILRFGERLLTTGDLDPVYIALAKAKMPPEKLKRWMLVYWTFYHCGVASYITDSKDLNQFWERWHWAALNLAEKPTPFGARWPRGHERRHMRGKNAESCWEAMMGRYRNAPERFVDVCVPPATRTTCREVVGRVSDHVQFGPWIGFKVADMVERVMGAPVDFTNAEVFVFDDPKKAAVMLYKQMRTDEVPPAQMVEVVVSYLTREFAAHKAPPHFERPVGLQEVETILCKWKSHCNGHYPLRNDITEIRLGLTPWTEYSPTATRLLMEMPG